jgi:DNA-binding NarL/FixJ family response regulator
VLFWAQEQAVRQEHVGRTTPVLQVIVCAATGMIQHGLQSLVEHAGARVIARTPYPRNLPDLLDATVEITAVVTTRAEFQNIIPIAQQYHLPIVCVVAHLADGLTVVEHAAAVALLGIVLDLSDEQQTIMHMEHVLHRIAHRERVMPAALQEPFATLKLSELERDLLCAEVQGLTDIANRLRIDQATLRQRRKRLREKLHVPEEQSLGAWAERWWLVWSQCHVV